MSDEHTLDPGPPPRSGSERIALLAFLASLVAAVLVTGLGWLGFRAIVVATTPIPPVVAQAERLGVMPSVLSAGRSAYMNTCAVCHGQDARGLIGLGKPLRNNEFVQSSTDEELAAFVATGRPVTDPENTTGIPMPPRAGNQNLSDHRIFSIVTYLRLIQDASASFASMEDWTVEATGGAAPSGPGHDQFVTACSACHGADGAGLPGMGKSLRSSEFVADQSDEDLIRFIKTGRPIWDSANTTGVDMPPKGGNPALTDEEMRLIVDYIRQIHE